MKKASIILSAILIWEFLWVIFTLSLIIFGITNGSYWSDPAWNYIIIESERLRLMLGKRVIAIVYTLFIPIGITGCIGLLKRRNWGRQFSIFAMGVSAFSLIFTGCLAFILYDYNYRNLFVEVIAPVLLILFLVLISVLSIIYLNKYYIKEMFKSI